MKEYFVEYYDTRKHDFLPLRKFDNIRSATRFHNMFKSLFSDVKYRIIKKVRIDTNGKKY